jgi:hypothetical protein
MCCGSTLTRSFEQSKLVRAPAAVPEGRHGSRREGAQRFDGCLAQRAIPHHLPGSAAGHEAACREVEVMAWRAAQSATCNTSSSKTQVGGRSAVCLRRLGLIHVAKRATSLASFGVHMGMGTPNGHGHPKWAWAPQMGMGTPNGHGHPKWAWAPKRRQATSPARSHKHAWRHQSADAGVWFRLVSKCLRTHREQGLKIFGVGEQGGKKEMELEGAGHQDAFAVNGRAHRGTKTPPVEYRRHFVCSSQDGEEQEDRELGRGDGVAFDGRDIHDGHLKLGCCHPVHTFKTRSILLDKFEAHSLSLLKARVVSPDMNTSSAHLTWWACITAAMSSRDRRVMRGTATSTSCDASTAGTSFLGTATQFQWGLRALILAIQGLKSSPQNRTVGRCAAETEEEEKAARQAPRNAAQLRGKASV